MASVFADHISFDYIGVARILPLIDKKILADLQTLEEQVFFARWGCTQRTDIPKRDAYRPHCLLEQDKMTLGLERMWQSYFVGRIRVQSSRRSLSLKGDLTENRYAASVKLVNTSFDVRRIK